MKEIQLFENKEGCEHIQYIFNIAVCKENILVVDNNTDMGTLLDIPIMLLDKQTEIKAIYFTYHKDELPFVISVIGDDCKEYTRSILQEPLLYIKNGTIWFKHSEKEECDSLSVKEAYSISYSLLRHKFQNNQDLFSANSAKQTYEAYNDRLLGKVKVTTARGERILDKPDGGLHNTIGYDTYLGVNFMQSRSTALTTESSLGTVMNAIVNVRDRNLDGFYLSIETELQTMIVNDRPVGSGILIFNRKGKLFFKTDSEPDIEYPTSYQSFLDILIDLYDLKDTNLNGLRKPDSPKLSQTPIDVELLGRGFKADRFAILTVRDDNYDMALELLEKVCDDRLDGIYIRTKRSLLRAYGMLFHKEVRNLIYTPSNAPKSAHMVNHSEAFDFITNIYRLEVSSRERSLLHPPFTGYSRHRQNGYCSPNQFRDNPSMFAIGTSAGDTLIADTRSITAIMYTSVSGSLSKQLVIVSNGVEMKITIPDDEQEYLFRAKIKPLMDSLANKNQDQHPHNRGYYNG